MTLEQAITRFQARDVRALARLLSWVAAGEFVAEIEAALPQAPVDRDPRQPLGVVAIAGSAGVGKSTFIARLIGSFRNTGWKIAVLACDPESALTGGALLGDRVRMPVSATDHNIFIRSLAAPEGHQGLAPRLSTMVRLLQLFGFPLVLIETAGLGQNDVQIRSLCDLLILLLQPQTGDSIQWEKAGLLEMADAVVVHKADLPGASELAAQLRDEMALAPGHQVPVFLVSSAAGTGVEDVRDWIAGRLQSRASERQGFDAKRLHDSVDTGATTELADRLLQQAMLLFRQRLHRHPDIVVRLLQDPATKDLPPDQLALELIQALLQNYASSSG
ncbi:MAG: hypothetical protein C4297_00855 [Gemmataceae bacterium]